MARNDLRSAKCIIRGLDIVPRVFFDEPPIIPIEHFISWNTSAPHATVHMPFYTGSFNSTYFTSSDNLSRRFLCGLHVKFARC